MAVIYYIYKLNNTRKEGFKRGGSVFFPPQTRGFGVIPPTPDSFFFLFSVFEKKSPQRKWVKKEDDDVLCDVKTML